MLECTQMIKKFEKIESIVENHGNSKLEIKPLLTKLKEIKDLLKNKQNSNVAIEEVNKLSLNMRIHSSKLNASTLEICNDIHAGNKSINMLLEKVNNNLLEIEKSKSSLDVHELAMALMGHMEPSLENHVQSVTFDSEELKCEIDSIVKEAFGSLGSNLQSGIPDDLIMKISRNIAELKTMVLDIQKSKQTLKEETPLLDNFFDNINKLFSESKEQLTNEMLKSAKDFRQMITKLNFTSVANVESVLAKSQTIEDSIHSAFANIMVTVEKLMDMTIGKLESIEDHLKMIDEIQNTTMNRLAGFYENVVMQIKSENTKLRDEIGATVKNEVKFQMRECHNELYKKVANTISK